jgi:hypothetical protein
MSDSDFIPPFPSESMSLEELDFLNMLQQTQSSTLAQPALSSLAQPALPLLAQPATQPQSLAQPALPLLAQPATQPLEEINQNIDAHPHKEGDFQRTLCRVSVNVLINLFKLVLHL